MKARYLLLLPAICFFVRCGEHDKKNSTNTEVIKIDENKDDTSTVQKAELVLQSEIKIKKVIDYYLLIKNALLADDTKSAGLSGDILSNEIKAINPNWLDQKSATIFSTYGGAVELYARKISSSKGKLAEQKEHFEQMCASIFNLTKTFGSNKPLYKKFCSTFNNGQGGYWLSEVNEPENPFYANSKLICVKNIEAIKQ